MDANTVAAIGATVTAVASLGVSVYEARASRRHDRLSVRPLLELQQGWVDGQRSGLMLVNVGVGPAVMRSTALSLDGVLLGEFDREHTEALRGSLSTRPDLTSLGQERGIRYLGPGTTHFLLSVPAYNASQHTDFHDLVDQRISLAIVYESLYGTDRTTTAYHPELATPAAPPPARHAPDAAAPAAAAVPES